MLAAHIMDAKAIWNHNALFDYQDRYMEVTSDSGPYPTYRSQSPFAEEMWDTYRQDYGTVWSGAYDFVAPNAPTQLLAVAQSVSSIQLSWQVPLAAIDGDLPVAYRVFRGGTMIADVLAATVFVDTGLSPNTAYDYRVYSIDSTGIESAYAVTISLTTLAQAAASLPPSFGPVIVLPAQDD